MNPAEPKEAARELSPGCVVLFLLPFAAVGGVMGVMCGRRVMEGNWKEAGLFFVFAFIFGAVGFGGLAATLLGWRKQKALAAIKAANPDSPWLWREDWAAGMVESTNRGRLATMWVFAVFWNLISWTITIAFAMQGVWKQQRAAYFVWLFPLLGAAFLGYAIYLTVQWRKFGKSTFKMISVPGVIGGKLAGAIETSVKVKPADGFEVRLMCINEVSTGYGRNRRTTQDTVFEINKSHVHDLLETSSGRCGIPVLFDIPQDAQESNSGTTRNFYFWRLEAMARVPGVDYVAQFEVPVFKIAPAVPPAST